MRRVLPVVLVCLSALPAFGQDDHSNDAQGATVLSTSGAKTSGNIESGGDRDVFRFAATAGAKYAASTGDLNVGSDTLLDLYDPRGRHMTRDDDGAGGLASKIEFTASQTATYWLVVRQYSRDGTGRYTIRVQETTPAASTPAPSGGSTATPTPPPPSNSSSGGAQVSLSTRVLDPKLNGASLTASTQLTGSGSYRATLRVLDGAGNLVRTLVNGSSRQAGRTYGTSWDGTDAQGAAVAPGSYSLRFEATRAGATARASASLQVVRLGLISVSFLANGRVPLTYHRPDRWSGNRFPVDSAGPAWTLPSSPLGATCLDARDGSALGGPPPSRNISGPPRTSSGGLLQRGRSLPLAFTQGARPRVRVTLGERAAAGGSAVRCGYPLSGAALRIVAEGGSSSASAGIRPGDDVTLDLPAVPRGLGKHTLSFTFRFQVRDGTTWRDVPGSLVTRHPAYVVVAAPPTGNPWVAALDLAAGWCGGQITTAATAMRRVVEGVNGALGLRYDVSAGAPAYTDGWSLENPSLDLDAFLDGLQNGQVVNCLDCASLVSVLGAQLGIDSRIAIIGWDFRLNWLRGIGWQDFTSSLFGGYHAFSYHAVATVDRGRSVHDACLSVDDDDRPWSGPHTELLPAGLRYSRYIDQLSPDRPPVRDLGRASVR